MLLANAGAVLVLSVIMVRFVTLKGKKRDVKENVWAFFLFSFFVFLYP